MEVVFLDVAQGSCQIILIGRQRAIVIDCGGRGSGIIQALKDFQVESIECLIVTHSHTDHAGGALAVLGNYQARIKRLCVVQDDLFLESLFWARISTLIEEKVLTEDQFVRLEVNPMPQRIWTDDFGVAELTTISPSPFENFQAQDAKKPNSTSAILVLRAYRCKIVFASDSQVGQWRRIHRRFGKIICDVLVVPHHAGSFHESQEDIDWFVDKAVEANLAVVSAGTNNGYEHPRSDVIKALTSGGAKVMCTQITPQCHAKVESLHPGVIDPKAPGRSWSERDVTSTKSGRSVACAGTVVCLLSKHGVEIERFSEHQSAILSKVATPLCRKCPPKN